MKFKVIRDLPAKGGNRELMLEVDEEFLNVYRAEMEVEDFDQESFNKWVEILMDISLDDGEEWKYDEEKL